MAAKTLELLALKIGVGDHEKVISKSAEFERLLQNKMTAGGIVTDTAKAVICLDLAASYFGVDFDTKLAIKFSGLRGPSYSNSRKTIENLLELKVEQLTVQSLCLHLQCTGAQELAAKILDSYRCNCKSEIDLSMPQYVCMAVYQACRLRKVKVSKSKFVEKSRLKPSQWTKMDAEWTNYADENFPVVVKKRCRPAKENVTEDITVEEKMELGTETIKEIEPEQESYEDWKSRMLESAHREMKNLNEKSTVKLMKDVNMDLEHSPRRSPRKTPQKFSPYKTIPGKGVKLLFPL